MVTKEIQPQHAHEIKQAIKGYQLNIEKLIRENIHELGLKTTLRDACEYALTNGGKRFRPALVYMIANALQQGADVSQAALSVEYLHTASLIADDLPCMDDDDERRSKPSTHKVYGESTALLASYALIAAGYECLAKNARSLSASKQTHAKNGDRIGVLALGNVTYNTGLFGATGGQFLDINPPDLTMESLIDIIKKKTVSLFEISFVLGWLFGGGDIAELPKVKKAALHFGLAFQIADDLQDVEQDKANGRKVNVACVFGAEKAKKVVHCEIEAYKKIIQALPIEKKELLSLVDLLN